MDVVDRVDLAPADLRTRLTQSTQSVFEQQAIPVAPEAIVQAVDAHLMDNERGLATVGMEDHPPVVSDAGAGSDAEMLKAAWDRPTTMEEHSRRITPTSRKERFFWWLGHRSQESEIAGTWEPRMAPFMGLTFGVPALGAALGGWLFGFWGAVIVGEGLLMGFLCTLKGSGTKIHFRVTENRKAKNLPANALREWARVPEAQAYAKACLNSAVPMILAKDREHLDGLCAAAAQVERAAQQREEERLQREKDDAERQTLLDQLKSK